MTRKVKEIIKELAESEFCLNELERFTKYTIGNEFTNHSVKFSVYEFVTQNDCYLINSTILFGSVKEILDIHEELNDTPLFILNEDFSIAYINKEAVEI